MAIYDHTTLPVTDGGLFERTVSVEADCINYSVNDKMHLLNKGLLCLFHITFYKYMFCCGGAIKKDWLVSIRS